MGKKKHAPLGKSKKKTFKDIKNTTYRGSCKTGYKGPKNNAHHLVPCISLRQSLIAYLSGKPRGYKYALAFFTVYDVNAGYNLLGLPAEEAYRLVFASMNKRGLKTGRPAWISVGWRNMTTPKYPIHIPSNWGHDKYNVRVQTQLDDVWTALDGKHESHEMPDNADDLGTEIKTIGTTCRTTLQGKIGQTIDDWKNGNRAPFEMV